MSTIAILKGAGLREIPLSDEDFYYLEHDPEMLEAARNLSPLQMECLKEETEWVPNEEYENAPRIGTDEEIRQIGTGAAPCPLCHGRLTLGLHVIGKTTGMRMRKDGSCLCASIRAFWHIWAKYVPERYQGCSLDNLAPSPKSRLQLDKQAAIIAVLQREPDASYTFTGDYGSGKSHFGYSLLRRAVEYATSPERSLQHRSMPAVWAVSVPTLLQEFRDHQGDVERPVTVLPQMIRSAGQAGKRICLMLDEVDKFSVTEPRMDFLFELVNAATNAGGQVIAISNLPVAALRSKWGDVGGPLLDRLCHRHGAKLVEFV